MDIYTYIHVYAFQVCTRRGVREWDESPHYIHNVSMENKRETASQRQRERERESVCACNVDK